jgi:O-antigen/teichoic acid export membrane protein
MRTLLLVFLPLALPFLAYGVYLALVRRKARLASEGNLPSWQNAPWHLILILGVVLVLAGLLYYREISGVPPGVRIEKSRVIDGEMKPAQPVE